MAGACALVWAQYPAENYRQIIQRVLASTDKLPSLAGKCRTGGRLNLHKALTAPAEAPAIICPADITQAVDPGKCDALVSFAATATDNSSTTIAYDINGTPITSPHTFPVGTTTVRAVATDAAGNSSQCTFTVTIEQNNPPAITTVTGPLDPLAKGSSATVTG